MQLRFAHVFAGGLFALAFSMQAFAQPEQLIELQSSGARTFAASRGQSLAPANAAGHAATAGSFLRAQGRPQSTIDSLFIENEHRSPATGVTHVRFEQRVQGLDVYGTYVKAAFNARGDLVHLIELLADPPAQLVRAVAGPEAALNNVARQLYPARSFTFTEAGRAGNTIEFTSGDTYFFKNPTITRVAVPLRGAVMQEGYLVETWTRTDNQLHHSVVSATGRVLHSELRTANENYFVYPVHPNVGAQITLPGAAIGEPYSPAGWISNHGRTGGTQFQFRMSGNNVDAFLDRDNNNSPDTAGTSRSGPDYGTVVDKSADPTTATNQEAAIVHLFYSNNVIHDKLYRHGFTETTQNFQEYNFGNGGAQNDSVMAEAQDGGGTNNANFATPSDGSRPRMQMYIWDFSNPRRDGDLDSDIVFHEYGHGLTWRMIGGMSGCMSGAIGEGASDTLSIWMNANDVVGEYSYNNLGGIRRWPYTDYPRTYSDLTNEGVHAGGELFAAIMWRAREKFLAHATFTTEDLWTAFVDGMNYIASGPKYENMRDGIVQAAGGTTSEKGCLIYKAFAEYGVGQGAVGSCTVSGSPLFPRTTWNNTESFLQHPDCANPPEPEPDIAITAVSATSPVFTGTSHNVSVTVANSSTVNVADTFQVLLSADDIVVAQQDVAKLAAGESLDLQFSWTTPVTATTVKLTGWHNASPDANPGNNELSTYVVVDAPPPPSTMTLTVTRVVNKGRRDAVLNWTGATSMNVDIYRNSSKLITVANTGTYTDQGLNRNTTYTFQVCEAGSTSACSNVVSITM